MGLSGSVKGLIALLPGTMYIDMKTKYTCVWQSDLSVLVVAK
jgi:hypothetical protein